LAALQHRALDKLSLFANDGERDRHYLVAESLVCADEEVRALQRHQLAGSLMAHLHELICGCDDSVLKKLSGGDMHNIGTLMDRNPAFIETTSLTRFITATIAIGFWWYITHGVWLILLKSGC